MSTLALVLLLGVTGADSAGAKPASSEYRKEAAFSPVRLSYAEFTETVRRAHELAENANSQAEKPLVFYEAMEVSDGIATVRSKGVFTSADISMAPPVAFLATYRYSRDDCPVSEITITLSDYTRSVSVTGSKPEQVIALFSMLSDEIGSRTTFAGGIGFRVIAGSLILAVLVVLSRVVPEAVDRGLLRTVLAIYAIVLVGGLCLLALPWTRWLPGAALYSSDASFVVRNAPQITFFGVILSVVIPMLGGIVRFCRSRRKSDRAETKVDHTETGEKAIAATARGKKRQTHPPPP